MTVAPTAPYAPQNGTVTYVITVENDSTDAAQAVTVTDTLPQGFSFKSTNGVVINGKNAGSRLQPAAGSATPQWGPFIIPAGGFNGATLVITFTANVNGGSLGAAAIVILVVALALRHQEQQSTDNRLAFQTVTGTVGQEIPDEGPATHVDPQTTPTYKFYPPTSGPHYSLQGSAPVPWQTIDNLVEGQ